jgi:6-pyruvoyl-tetrahydropterin synthase
MSTLFVQRLTVVDFSYLDGRRGLLGESWQLDVELTGTLDHQGMVLDFGEVKHQVKRHADTFYDHKLIVPQRNPGCVLTRRDGSAELRFTTADGAVIRHLSPADALCPLDSVAVTPEAVARDFVTTLKPQLPGNVESITVQLYPEFTADAFFHYSHGLRNHAGNCQRIAHGHRSRIVIRRDGKRDTALEAEWAERWRDIYIGTRKDLAAENEEGGVSYHRYRYRGSQGEFELSLPAANCYLIDTDSTIENLAQHVADTLHREQPGHRFEVRAFEGIGKGAVATPA